MARDLPPHTKDVLLKIGEQVKKLRMVDGKQDYKTYAEQKLKMNKNTYHRIEQGKNDYNISNLIELIDKYPDYSISDFFRDAGL